MKPASPWRSPERGYSAISEGGEDRGAAVAGRDLILLFTIALIVIAAAFGGASRENALRLAVVELFALPLGVLAIRRATLDRAARPSTAILLLMASLIALPAMQLLPLPPEIWRQLPGQAPRADALLLAGVTPGWLPVSLNPAMTLRSVLALLPPLAMFAATYGLRRDRSRPLILLWLACGAVGIGLGVFQLASPQGGPAYLYRTTNLGSLVGAFANRNHEAAFLLALVPLAASIVLGRGRRDVAVRVFAGLFIGLALLALAGIHSRAGVILAIPTLAVCLAVAARSQAARWARSGGLALAALAMVVVGAAMAFGSGPVEERFLTPLAQDRRSLAWPIIWRAAQEHLPFGAGIGAFDRVYQAAEPLDLIGPTYLNHAHNDFLELWLEAGWAAALLMLLFSAGWAWKTWNAWRVRSATGVAAAGSILLLAAASFSDYPLRTETNLVLFGFCAGLLASRGTRKQ